MKENYEYPLMPEWSKDEIITMVEFYAQVEDAYTTGVAKNEFMKMVRKFKHRLQLKSNLTVNSRNYQDTVFIKQLKR